MDEGPRSAPGVRRRLGRTGGSSGALKDEQPREEAGNRQDQGDDASSMKARAAGDSGASRWMSPSSRWSGGRSDATTAPWRLAAAAIGRGTTAAPAPATTSGT